MSNFISLHQSTAGGFKTQYDPTNFYTTSVDSQIQFSFANNNVKYIEYKVFLPKGTREFDLNATLAPWQRQAVVMRLGIPPSNTTILTNDDYLNRANSQNTSIFFQDLLDGKEVISVHNGSGTMAITGHFSSGEDELQGVGLKKENWIYIRSLQGNLVGSNTANALNFYSNTYDGYANTINATATYVVTRVKQLTSYNSITFSDDGDPVDITNTQFALVAYPNYVPLVGRGTSNYRSTYEPNKLSKGDSSTYTITSEHRGIPVAPYKFFVPPGTKKMNIDFLVSLDNFPSKAAIKWNTIPVSTSSDCTIDDANIDISKTLQRLISGEEIQLYAEGTKGSLPISLGVTDLSPIKIGGWNYLNVFTTPNEVINLLRITFEVDGIAYTSWYDNAIWDSNDNPDETVLHTDTGSILGSSGLIVSNPYAAPTKNLFDRLEYSYRPANPNTIIEFSTKTVNTLNSVQQLLPAWAYNDMKNENVGGYTKNPVANIANSLIVVMSTMRTYSNTIVGLEELNSKSNSCGHELQNFFDHTQRLSGVVEPTRKTAQLPHYAQAIGFGKAVTYMTYQADGYANSATILGGFTSLLCKSDLESYYANLVSDVEDVKKTTVFGGTTLTTKKISNITNNVVSLQTLIYDRRIHDENFYNNSKELLNDYNRVKPFTTMGESENYLVRNFVGTDKLLSRIGPEINTAQTAASTPQEYYSQYDPEKMFLIEDPTKNLSNTTIQIG